MPKPETAAAVRALGDKLESENLTKIVGPIPRRHITGPYPPVRLPGESPVVVCD